MGVVPNYCYKYNMILLILLILLILQLLFSINPTIDWWRHLWPTSHPTATEKVLVMPKDLVGWLLDFMSLQYISCALMVTL